ncbi:MAG TPA: GGDEF domain-containing protein [Candidatus Saccharimonadales bacterium]|nr:GGDEF domain-containing protein [Candidatus Saccharimonadales bacterium]
MDERTPPQPDQQPVPEFSPYDGADYRHSKPFELELGIEYARKMLGMGGQQPQQYARIHALEKQLGKDTMTKLYTKNAFLAHGEQLLAEQPDAEIAIFHIDLKDFKKLNDTGGHDYGDLALNRVADLLVRLCRSDDTDMVVLLEPRDQEVEPVNKTNGDAVARTGGDEFAILFNLSAQRSHISEDHQQIIVPSGYSNFDVPRRSVRDRTEGIYSRFEKARRSFLAAYPDYAELGLDFSVGVAIHEQDEPLAETLNRADLAGLAMKREQQKQTGSYR